MEEGGELVFPLANHPYQDIMKNSGTWHGYYIYSKTTGSKTYFTVDMTFSFTEEDDENQQQKKKIFRGKGREDEMDFHFREGSIEGSYRFFSDPLSKVSPVITLYNSNSLWLEHYNSNTITRTL